MNPRSKYLKQYFNNVKLLNDKVILNESTLKIIRANYNNTFKIKPSPVTLNEPYGIVALTDKYLRDYSITTFHYIDFRWYSIQMGAKIMHKANIEEWRGSNNFSCKFSNSPMRYSGDVVGIMPGDFRDCFNVIKAKEKERKLLNDQKIKLPMLKSNKTFSVQCGIGLESLTIAEKFTKENHVQFGLTFIN